MTPVTMRHRVQSTPIHLKPDRFEALVAAHEAYVARQPGGRRATLSFIVATGMRCDRRRLADARLDGADLRGTTFVGADFSRASLYCANLSRCDFRGAKLGRADLRGAIFNGANLGGANLDQADMRAAVICASDAVRGLRWVGNRSGTGEAAVSGEESRAVDFSNCSLQGALLRDANLKNVNFQGANLHGADLAGARLEGVSFRGAVMTGMDVEGLRLPKEALVGCLLDPGEAAAAKLDYIREELDRAQDWVRSQGKPPALDDLDLRPAAELFKGKLLAGLKAKNAVAVGVDFTACQLQGAVFEGADLRGADFTGADLRGANFTGANLCHAKFKDAVLGELELRPGQRLPSSFENALLHGVMLPPITQLLGLTPDA